MSTFSIKTVIPHGRSKQNETSKQIREYIRVCAYMKTFIYEICRTGITTIHKWKRHSCNLNFDIYNHLYSLLIPTEIKFYVTFSEYGFDGCFITWTLYINLSSIWLMCAQLAKPVDSVFSVCCTISYISIFC